MGGAIYGNSPLKNARQALLRGGAAGAASSGINYLSDALDTRKIREDALRRMAQGTVSPYARRSDPSGLCGVPDPFAGGVGYPAVRGYRYEGHPATGTAEKGGFNLADFGKELLTGFVAGGLSSAAFYGAGKAVEAVKGSVRSAGRGSRETELFLPDEYYQKMDDNIAKAIAARDAEIAKVQGLSKTQQSNIATVAAGVDIRTGDVCLGVKNSRVYEGNATCAEDIVFRGLGGNTNSNIIMTPAIRPRNNEVIPVCVRCQTKYPKNQFLKGTKFQ